MDAATTTPESDQGDFMNVDSSYHKSQAGLSDNANSDSQMQIRVNNDPGCLLDRPEVSPVLPPPAVRLEELSDLACLKDIKLTMEFIRALDSATLDDEYSHLDSDTLERLRNPPTSPANVSNPDFCLGLDLFLASLNTSQDTYNIS